MTHVSKAAFIAIAFVCLALSPAYGQNSGTMFLAAGGGYDGTAGMTATLGIPASENNYILTSADVSTKQLPNGKRALFTTMRPGYQRVLLNVDLGTSGSILLAASADVGVSSGGDSLTGSMSTGGTLVYMLPKHPNLGFYANYRAVKGPAPIASDGGVQGRASFGVLLKLSKN